MFLPSVVSPDQRRLRPGRNASRIGRTPVRLPYLSGPFSTAVRRIRSPTPLAAGTAFRRRDPSTVSRAIDGLLANGRGTRSTFGLTVGKDFLDNAPDEHHKVLVLLTYARVITCLRPNGPTGNCALVVAQLEQAAACTAAKGIGIEIFFVAAMTPSFVNGPLEGSLRDCSSDGDPPGESMYFSTTLPQKTCGRPSWTSPINWSWCGESTDRVTRSSMGGAGKAIV